MDKINNMRCIRIQFFEIKNQVNSIHSLQNSIIIFYPKNEIKTPAATAEPITPEILEDIAY